MKRLVILIVVIFLSGCAGLQTVRGGPELEGTWQLVNALDYSQTVTIAREPDHYFEADPTTYLVIGRHPSEQGVEAYWAAFSMLHFLVSSWLAREAHTHSNRIWTWAFYTWEAGSLGLSGRAVVDNHAIGLTLFGPRGPKGR
jgi:hypothetical protein